MLLFFIMPTPICDCVISLSYSLDLCYLFSEMTTRKPKPVCEYIVVLTMELFISIMVPMLSNGLCPYNIIGSYKQNI